MRAHECYHCKQWIEEGQPHDCWTTTEAALTEELTEELRDAWERLRETAADFGEQRIYASGTAIMFSRDSCYFFVRPRRKDLQVCVFLGREVRSPLVRRVERKSAAKFVNIVHITHRDQVEAPFTDWLREAYELPEKIAAAKRQTAAGGGRHAGKPSASSRKRTSVRKRGAAGNRGRRPRRR
jgi:hypothetical protein